jgi:serine/threonine protein kinase HipA of HipAB toxin-antitoxin module
VLRELAQACEDKLTTPVLLFRWLVFNLLVANDDCHLKNLSFLVTPGRVDLAPHYDLLATGGTAKAATVLIQGLGATIAGCFFAVELGFLPGRERLKDHFVDSLIHYG